MTNQNLQGCLKNLTILCNEVNHGYQDHLKVIDGGWLLYHFRCQKNMTYQELDINYESFLSNNFSFFMLCLMDIFISIKDHVS